MIRTLRGHDPLSEDMVKEIIATYVEATAKQERFSA